MFVDNLNEDQLNAQALQVNINYLFVSKHF